MQLSLSVLLILLIAASCSWLGPVAVLRPGLGVVVSWVVVSMFLLSLVALSVAGKRTSPS